MRISGGIPFFLFAAGLLAACTSDNTSTSSSTFAAKVTTPAASSASDTEGTVAAKVSTYRIGGTVSGLAGQGLMLDVNGVSVPVRANGSFTAPVAMLTGTAYAVKITAQPSGPNQLCVLGGESGTIGTSSVKTVTIDCFTDRYVVGGNATGIIGAGVVIQINGGDDIRVSANGKFAFPTTLPSGALYNATVKTKPLRPSQTCTITSGAGLVSDANVTGIALDCALDTYKIGGTVTGLDGTGLVLQDNHGDDLPVSANGQFKFATGLDSGRTYSVSVKHQPAGRTQDCVVGGGTGDVGGADVSTVTVNCSTSSFMVGGNASHIAGTVHLQLNGGHDAYVTGDGTFAFPDAFLSGTTYTASIKEKPLSPSQTCQLTGASDTVGGSDVTSIGLSCSTDTFKVGGTITGLAGTLVLQNNGGDDLTLTNNDPWSFAANVASGDGYNVQVLTQPANQTCTVTAGTDTMGNADYAGASISCVANGFAVGGTVSGLATGDSIVLVNNGAGDITLNADGPFSFGPVATGATYEVKVKTAPATNSQCTVSNGGPAALGSAAVSNITVSCQAPSAAPAYAGNYTDFGTPTTHFSRDYLLGNKVTITTAASVTGLAVIGKSTGSHIMMALYTDVGGNPSQLVVSTPGTALINGRLEIPVTPTAVSAGTYWLMAVYDIDAQSGSKADASSVVGYQSFAYGTALPTTFGAASQYSGQAFNYYVLLQ